MENRVLEDGVLITGHDESVKSFTPHGIADILKSTVDFRLAWQRLPPDSGSLHAAKLSGGQCIDLSDIHQRLEANFFAFPAARSTGRPIVHSRNSIAAENTGVGTPGDNFAIWTIAHHSLVIRVNGANHGVFFTDAGARNGNISFEFEAPVWMLLFEIEENRLNVTTCFTHSNRRRDAHVEKQIGFFRRAASSPGVAAANPAQIDDSLLSAVGGLFLPRSSPLHDCLHQLMHAADGVHLFAAFAECGVHVNAGAGNAHPHRAEVLQHHVHVRGLAENAHVRHHAMIYKVGRAAAVASRFPALVLAPLRFLDFSRDRRDDYVALKLHTGALQPLDCLGVANQRAFHVVDAETVYDTVLDDGVRLVTDPREKFLAARVRRIHVAVEHQVLADDGAGLPPNDIGAPFFHLLPGYV